MQTQKFEIVDRHGKVVPGGTVVPDGGSIRVAMTMMDAAAPPSIIPRTINDAAGHRPGAVAVSVQDRERRSALVKDANAKLSDRWRNPPALAVTADATRSATPPQPVAAKDLNGMYAAADRKLEQRWRGAA